MKENNQSTITFTIIKKDNETLHVEVEKESKDMTNLNYAEFNGAQVIMMKIIATDLHGLTSFPPLQEKLSAVLTEIESIIELIGIENHQYLGIN